jgi:ubiquitin carboxyl-terminal hydrolase 48
MKLVEDLPVVDSISRDEGLHFTGLKNLGATCYVNALLQLLFHNHRFRRAIYQWNPAEDPKEKLSFLASVPSPAPSSSSSSHSNGNNGDKNGADPSNKTSTSKRKSSRRTKSVKSEAKTSSTNDAVKSEPGTSASSTAVTKPDSTFTPKSAIGQLQRTFALMQFGKFNFVDPSDFVQALDLDKNEQQDAQEFCKLFLNVLEEDLASQSIPFVRSIVQSEFIGEYSYITRCQLCRDEKLDPSPFYELSLNMENCKKLEECLERFFSSEMLEGSNSYNCANCGPQMATRRIGLTALPPVLNVQLLRFVYDRTKGTRRKINSEISFPEELDMGQYFKFQTNTPVKSQVRSSAGSSAAAGASPPLVNIASSSPASSASSSSASTSSGNMKYHLKAVLLHFGKTCGAGHYVAHIRDKGSNCYFKFNDEKVERIDAKNFKKDLDSLNSDKDGAGAGEQSGQQSANASSTNKRKDRRNDPNRTFSTNAYMLVYQSAARGEFRCSRSIIIRVEPVY